MKKPSVRSDGDRAAAIARALRNAIMDQALAPGVKLPEDAIGERFGVSRTIARHALGQLAAEGLVELRHNKGAAVATPSWDEARDVFEVRIAVERIVMTRLAGRLTERQVAALHDHVDREEEARGRHEPLSIRLASEFHMLLAEMIGSPVLARYVRELASRCGLTLARFQRPHSSDCAVSEHRALIAALVDGDADRAVAMMDAHLDGVMKRALIEPACRKDVDLKAILAPYAEEEPAPRVASG